MNFSILSGFNGNDELHLPDNDDSILDIAAQAIIDENDELLSVKAIVVTRDIHKNQIVLYGPRYENEEGELCREFIALSLDDPTIFEKARQFILLSPDIVPPIITPDMQLIIDQFT